LGLSVPFFSIIIPVYNREKYLKRALDSLTVQTFQNFEVIIVDDASTDYSLEIAKKWEFPHKVIIENETNLERCISRNKGIAKAKSEYICFLDSDDYHLPNHLETLYREIKALAYPKAFFFTNAWNGIEGKLKKRICPKLNKKNIYYYLLTYTPNPQRWAVHKSLFDKIDFDAAIPGLEDLDLLLRSVKHITFYQIEERTTVYVQHNESYTLSSSRALKELKGFRYIFAKPELCKQLPSIAKKRLLSMCHYYLAVQADEVRDITSLYYHGFTSFFLYPKGYNGNTNKILLVMLLYNIPIFGKTTKLIRRVIRIAPNNRSINA